MHLNRLHLGVESNGQIFISRTLPLVCQNIPSVIPLIGRNKPFVINRHIVGLTFIELIIALTIAGILLAIAIPNFRTFLSNQRLTTQANELIADFNLARSEAIKRTMNVGICASTTGTNCSGAWQNGWIVFVDADNSRSWTSGDTVLRIHEPITSDTAITGSSSIAVFSSSGLLDSGTGAGNYTLCNSQAGQSRTVGIATTGRSSMSSGTC